MTRKGVEQDVWRGGGMVSIYYVVYKLLPVHSGFLPPLGTLLFLPELGVGLWQT